MSLTVPAGIGAGGALQVVRPNLELSLKHGPVLLAAATGPADVIGRGVSSEDLLFAKMQIERVNGERVSPSDAARLAAYLLLAVRHPDGPGFEIVAGELAEVIEGYPPDIAGEATKIIIRKSRVRNYIAAFVEAAEGLIEPRRMMLRGAKRLLDARHKRDAVLDEERRWQEQRRAEIESATTVIRERWGASVPTWFDLQSAYWGSGRYQIKGWPMSIAEVAGKGDAAAMVYLRRGCTFELALAAGIVVEVAKLLAAGDDAGAYRLVAAVPAYDRPQTRPSGPSVAREVEDAIRAALSTAACQRAAIAEGLADAAAP